MKIRLDFVTNSSSSSFTCVALYSEELYNFLQKLISEKKYIQQPSWGYSRPEYELYLDWRWEELKFDRTWYKVQTTEQYGGTDKESVYKHISSFFEGLTSEEKETLQTLISEVYKTKEYQTKKYEDQTDGFAGFDFRNKFTKADESDNKKDEKIQDLVDTLGRMAVDPETEDLSMKIIAMNFYQIDGHGIYDPDSDRYKHLDKSFLDRVKLGWVDSDYTKEYVKYLLFEEKKKAWAEHLRTLYEDAIDDTGAIAVGSISSRIDYAVVFDSMDSAVEKYELESFLAQATNKYRFSLGFDRAPEDKLEVFKKNCYIRYLQNAISFLEEANSIKGEGNQPIAIIWESQLHDYLMKHTSLGNVKPEPVIGPNGTVRLKIPEQHKKAMGYVIAEMVGRWPSRVINPKTRTYEKMVSSIEECNKDIGYANTDSFFDAYGFAIKQDAARENTSKYGGFEYEKTKKTGEITIVKYIGTDTKVSIPDSIEGNPVTTIGTEAFCRNKDVEEVTVPDSVTIMRGRAFSFCGNLKKVRLSNNIAKIVAETFDGCGSLEEINIPDKVQQLPSGLFKDCPLKRLHIGKALSQIDRDDFFKGELTSENNLADGYVKTSSIESISISPENRNLKAEGTMILSADGKVLFAMLGEEAYCRIPDGVEIIADSAFARQWFLKEVSFPESLRLIGNKAFELSGIESVTFTGNLKTIGADAFHFCSNLMAAEFVEGLEEIYNNAFFSTSISKVVLPHSLKKLGNYSFDKWRMERIEPVEWVQETQRWSDFTRESVNTQKYIEEVKKAGKQAAVTQQLEKKTEFGIQGMMMAYLQSDNAKDIDLTERLKLEQIIISKEMESILGIDLKFVLQCLKKGTTEELRQCVDYLKTEADKDCINEYLGKIRDTFSAESRIDILLDGVSRVIREEA